MARRTRYNDKITEQIVIYLRDGLTVRDACYGVRISEDTFYRWRHKYPEFSERVDAARDYAY